MSHIIVNGNKVSAKSYCISPFDRGLTLGHGLFETILVNKGSAPLLDYHWNRLATSVKYLGISLPFNIKDLTNMIAELIHANDLPDTIAGLRLTIND